MNRFRWVGFCLALAWLSAGCVCAADGEKESGKAEAVVIPLDQIWAYNMPGTRDILMLDREQVQLRPLGTRVGGPSSFISHQGKKIAGPGFAVLGTGMEAWHATHEKVPEGQEYRDAFPFGSKISVVFFSHGFGQYVHVHRVEQQGNVITIRYRFVPHRTKNFSAHFALIQVNELKPGKVQVNVVRTPMEKKYFDGGFKPTSVEEERRVVCKSFSFMISKSE